MSDYAPLIESAFALDPRERSYMLEEIEGEIPDYVRGTYYLNGPARFARGGVNYRHWLDGDGMVCALRFAGGRVHFTNRFVRSAKFVREEAAGRAIFRTFGTAFDADRLKRGIMLESPVNISVYPCAGTLLAFGEQGLPVELDPVTLETRGEFNFAGSLNEVSPFAAHPKFDRTTSEMFNFGIAFSATDPSLNVYRFDERGSLLYRWRLPLDYACSVHDFSLSRSYVIFYLSPYLLDMRALVRDGRSLLDSLCWEPERGSQLLIIRRDTGERAAMISVGRGYCLHLINSFETAGQLVIDVLELERPIYDQYAPIPALFQEVCAARPVRFIVDVENQELLRTNALAYHLAPDFPSIDPRQFAGPYEDFWMLGISATGRRGRKFFDQLVHASWIDRRASDTYQTPPLHYLAGEPVFIGDPKDEKNGVVICQWFDARRVTSAFAIFDAFEVARGPLAMLRLEEAVHLGFHASFNMEQG